MSRLLCVRLEAPRASHALRLSYPGRGDLFGVDARVRLRVAAVEAVPSESTVRAGRVLGWWVLSLSEDRRYVCSHATRGQLRACERTRRAETGHRPIAAWRSASVERGACRMWTVEPWADVPPCRDVDLSFASGVR